MVDNLLGEYERKLEGKGRVQLPASMRKALPDDVVLAPGLNGEACIFSPEGFQNWLESLFEADGGYSSTNAKHVKMRQWFRGAASNVEVDKGGRINIPESLRKRAGLEGLSTVLITGDGDHACIWSKEAWDAYMADFDPADVLCLS